MTTKDIRTSHTHTVVCDVCGRTLLRGELADIYIAGSDRRSVCELCKPRALHEGWVREGTLPEYDRAATGADRRRGLFARFRQHRGGRGRRPAARLTLDDELAGRARDLAEPGPTWDQADSGNGNGSNQAASANGWGQVAPAVAEGRPEQATDRNAAASAADSVETPGASWQEPPSGASLQHPGSETNWQQPDAGPGPGQTASDGSPPAGWLDGELRPPLERFDLSEPPPPEGARRPRSTRELAGDERLPVRPSRRGRRRPGKASAKERRSPPREPRHVRAVPSSHEQKVAAAVKLFNQSEHRRTVAGVAKSLGGPCVSVLPAGEPPSFVRIVISWELCWYRYTVDLADELPSVRADGQGAELSELTADERTATARADDTGQLLIP